MINVAKAVIKELDRYLLLKRAKDSKFFPEEWDFPGGKLEPGETPTESVIRETREETSLLIKKISPEPEMENKHIEKGEEIHYRIYNITRYVGQVNLSKEHTEAAWLTKEQMKQLKLTPFVRRYFGFN